MNSNFPSQSNKASQKIISNLFSLNAKSTSTLQNARSSSILNHTPKLPLSEIQNSIQKVRKKRSQSKSKSRSKSKQNTPQKGFQIQKSSSYLNLGKNGKASIQIVQKLKLQDKIVKNSQNIENKKNTLIKKNEGFLTYIDDVTRKYKGDYSYQSSSDLAILKLQQKESNISMVWSQYQLPINSKVSQKNVRFKEQILQLNDIQSKNRENANKILKKDSNNNIESRIKSPSILKKRCSGESFNSQRGYSISSANSSTKNSRQKPKQLVDLQNVAVNKTIRAKYQQIIKKYQELNLPKNKKKKNSNANIVQKFKDEMFPPINSSIYNSKSFKFIQEDIKSKITWKRIGEIFQKKQAIVLRSQNKSLIKVTKKSCQFGLANQQMQFVSDYLINCINMIRQNKTLLNKIFQDQKHLNPYGVYILKIFQENSWKYVIIDDYIPVIQDKNQNFTPLFLNIQKSQSNYQNIYQIWPFLLQKAFASFYSSYQALTEGNQIDFLSEITGSPYQKISIKKSKFLFQHQYNKISEQNSNSNQLNSQKLFSIQTFLKQQKIILIGQKIQKSCKLTVQKQTTQNLQMQTSKFYSIISDNNLITKKSLGFLIYLDIQKNYKPHRAKSAQILKQFENIYIFSLQNYKFLTQSALCSIPNSNIPKNDESLKNKNLKAKTDSIRSPKSNNLSSNKQNNNKLSDISLRTFQISVKSNCILAIKQKQKRFYYNLNLNQSSLKSNYNAITSSLNSKSKSYDYIWVRAIILLKQYNNDYRWIQGRYSKQKQLIFNLKNLQPGEYYLLLMPQWNQNCRQDISLNLFSQNCVCPIQRKIYNIQEQIFQKGCSDVAQRLGKLNQVNKYICSYNFINQESGLVIENIHNERSKGLVTIMRSINGLKCQVQLIPVNKEFYFQTNGQYENQGISLKKMKKTIEVDIEKNCSFTVILKTKGGIDKKFFESFDFGS